MKKILSCVLLTALLLSFASCGGSDDETKAQTNEPATDKATQTTGSSTDAATDAVTEEATDAATDGSTDAVTDEATNAVTDDPLYFPDIPLESVFQYGDHGDDAYTSEFIKLGFTLPSGWHYATQAELDALVGITEDMTDDEKQQIVENMKSIYDAVIFSADYTSNLIVMCTKSEAPISEIDQDALLDTLAKEIKDQYAAVGLTDVTYEKHAVNIDGVDFPGFDLVAGPTGLAPHQRMIVTTAGEYIVNVVITALDMAAVDSITDCIFVIE